MFYRRQLLPPYQQHCRSLSDHGKQKSRLPGILVEAPPVLSTHNIKVIFWFIKKEKVRSNSNPTTNSKDFLLSTRKLTAVFLSVFFEVEAENFSKFVYFLYERYTSICSDIVFYRFCKVFFTVFLRYIVRSDMTIFFYGAFCWFKDTSDYLEDC